MNNFTKEELRLMIMLITELKLDSTQPPCVDELKDKIKDMIDNYPTQDCQPIVNNSECDHSNNVGMPGSVMVKCDICGIPIWIRPYSECQHEDDGNCYYSIQPRCKCKKCGELYI